MIGSVKFGVPAHSSTPKPEEHQQLNQRNKMASQTKEENTVIESGAAEGYNRQTSFSRTVNTGLYSRETNTIPSSYRLRFGLNQSGVGYGLGARSRGYGYGGLGAGYGIGGTYQAISVQSGYRGGSRLAGLGALEASISSVSVDGLEVTPALLNTREEEKAVLGNLNDRFVTYIDKVRNLVSRNQVLEAKIKQLENSKIGTSPSCSIYEARLHNLQKEIERVIHEKTQVELELENHLRYLEDYKKKLEREKEDRLEAESEVKSLIKDVDQATLIRVDLESKVESLREELDLLRTSSEEDIRMLTQQLLNIQTGDITIDGSQQTDLSEALREIRASYEQLTQNNKIEIESYYKSKIADLNAQLKDEAGANTAQQTDLIETRRQLHTTNVELESLRTSYGTLESQLEEAEDRHQKEISKYKLNVLELEKELDQTREKVKAQLLAYNELLNIKCSLDLEIQTYRKLLDGEESRIAISGFGSGHAGSQKLSLSGSDYSQSVATSGGKTSGFGSGYVSTKLIEQVQVNVVETRVSDASTSDELENEDVDALKEVAQQLKNADGDSKYVLQQEQEALESDSESEI